MIQPTEHVILTEGGKMIEWRAIAELSLELVNEEGMISIAELMKELRMARDGIRRPENLEEARDKMMKGTISPEEYVKLHNTFNEHESSKMEECEPCGQAREFI